MTDSARALGFLAAFAAAAFVAGCGRNDADVIEPADSAGLPVTSPDCDAFASWIPSDRPDGAPRDPIENEISLDANGQLSWNGEPVPPETLAEYLSLVATMEPVPPLTISLSGDTPCADAREIIDQVKDAVDCDGGTCRYAISSTIGDGAG